MVLSQCKINAHIFNSKEDVEPIKQWACPSCGFVNQVHRDDCYKCNRNKPNENKIRKMEQRREQKT